MLSLDKLKNSQIAFYGLGQENQSLVNYLISRKIISEANYYDQKQVDFAVAAELNKINEEELANFDLIFISPGVSLYKDSVQRLVSLNKKIFSPNQLFFELNQSQKICITGSKGKSTLCKLLGEILATLDFKVFQAGNIGVPLCDQIENQADYAIIELSSYQIASLDINPDYAVLTSLFPEHLDWHLNLENYYRDKLNLFNNIENSFCANFETSQIAKQYLPTKNFKLTKDLIKDLKLSTKNTYFEPKHLQTTLNLSLTIVEDLLVGRNKSLSEYINSVQEVIDSFKALPFRLEKIATINKPVIINDSIATTSEAVIAAITSFSKKSQILIVGGYDRGLEQDSLIAFLLKNRLKRLICLPETGKNIYTALKDQMPCSYCENLEDAVKQAKQAASAEDIILFSPGAASYHAYQDFQERGQHFTDLISREFVI